MRATLLVGILAVALIPAGCGGGDSGSEEEPEEPPMKVEDTVFGDLVGTQDKARDRANAAVDLHRENMNSRLKTDEGTPPDDAPPEE